MVAPSPQPGLKLASPLPITGACACVRACVCVCAPVCSRDTRDPLFSLLDPLSAGMWVSESQFLVSVTTSTSLMPFLLSSLALSRLACK